MRRPDGWLRLHIANICNFDCPHCHVFKISDNAQPAKIMSQEVLRTSIESYLKSLRALGVFRLTINLYGGEPLLARKFLFDEILKVDQENPDFQIFWQMISNGSLLKPEDIDFFQKLRNFEFHLSLDGPTEVQNKSRPMKSRQDSFAAAIGALSLLSKSKIPIQMNSYLMPENIDSLKFLVDTAFKYNIKKIYLDILHSQDPKDTELFLEKYLEVLAYGRSKKIQISGPWRNLKLTQSGRSHLEARILGMDVLNDGRIFSSAFPLEKRQSYRLEKLNSFMSPEGLKKRSQKFTRYFAKACEGCTLIKKCQGGAMSQHHYHVGTEESSYQICDFFRKFTPLAFPQFSLHQNSKFSILSQVRSPSRISEFQKNIRKHVEFLNEKFLVRPHITFFIFKSRLGMKYYANAFEYPRWVTSFSGNQNQIFQVGMKTGKYLRHELGHVYLNQISKKIPSWLQEGICEYLAKGPFQPKEESEPFNLPISDWMGVCNQTETLISLNDNPPSQNQEYQKAYFLVSRMIDRYGWEKILILAQNSSERGLHQFIESEFKIDLSEFLRESLGPWVRSE